MMATPLSPRCPGSHGNRSAEVRVKVRLRQTVYMYVFPGGLRRVEGSQVF